MLGIFKAVQAVSKPGHQIPKQFKPFTLESRLELCEVTGDLHGCNLHDQWCKSPNLTNDRGYCIGSQSFLSMP
ncbi:hypothetical protein NPIL_515711 [Nephila pilipes]|uniref:Uncharacterized protein n=1 Tax=Nephila pilipes TaxID=299642 RepID=A0A8X6N6X8_NEPPI|nr:hypothetical protein NPIL_515711 [Nephila pilipes]